MLARLWSFSEGKCGVSAAEPPIRHMVSSVSPQTKLISWTPRRGCHGSPQNIQYYDNSCHIPLKFTWTPLSKLLTTTSQFLYYWRMVGDKGLSIGVKCSFCSSGHSNLVCRIKSFIHPASIKIVWFIWYIMYIMALGGAVWRVVVGHAGHFSTSKCADHSRQLHRSYLKVSLTQITLSSNHPRNGNKR